MVKPVKTGRARPFGIPRSVPMGYRTGMPPQMAITHKYVGVGYDTSSAATTNMSYESYRCNSPYDPYAKVGGHQALYFDQLAAIYNHYTVNTSRISWKITPSTGFVVAAIGIDDDATPSYLAGDNFLEQPFVSCVLMRPEETYTLTKSWNKKTAFGNVADSNPSFRGTGGTNPSEEQFWILAWRHVDALTAVQCNWIIEVEYDVVWSELKEMVVS